MRPTRFAALMMLFPVLAHAEPSPRAATWVSLASTLAPCAAAAALFASDSPEAGWALMAPAILVGPAAGYVYGGLPGRGLAGIGIRTGAAFAGVMAVGSMFDETNDSSGGAVLALITAAGVAASVAIDLALVGRDVRQRNQRRTVTLVPWRSRDGGPGIALRAEF